MKNFYFLFFILILANTVYSQHGWRKDEMEVKVFFNTNQEAKALYDLRVNGDFFIDYALVFVIPSELKKIKSLGLKHKIIIENLNAYYKDFWNNRDDYHSYQEIITIMDSLVDAFPDICRKESFGTSVGGRQLAALKISDNVATDEDEAEILFDGGIHGDEIGCSENLIRFARDLCYSYNNDQEITDLINNREIWLYIMVNPDGRVAGTRYNQHGVDLNRDWGYMWDGWGYSTGAYSQPESKALRSCMLNNQFVIHTAYHSGTEYISYPWSYRSDSCPDKPHIDYLASVYSNLSGYGFLDYGQGNSGMYAINGSTKDSNYGIMGSVTWSLEISYSKQPPASQIMMYYNYNRPSMISMIEHAGYGIHGNITDAETGEPVAAIIRFDESFPVYSDPEVGDYHKYVVPGTYSIKVIANGYETKTVEDIVVIDHQSIVEKDIELQSSENHYIYKVISCQIPNNNENDEGDTPAIFDAPDNDNYSIGKYGWIVVDMQDTIQLGPDTEITVHEGDDTPEGYTCYISGSMDGPWTILGSATGTTEFDFPDNFDARYIKIEDDGDGYSLVDNAGFDLDAIEVNDQSGAIVLLTGNSYVVDSITGNGNGRIDPDETVDIVIPLINEGEFTAEETYGTIISDPFHVTIENDSSFYGDINVNDSASGTFRITTSSGIPAGQALTIKLTALSYYGFYENTYYLDFIVGQAPLLIVDLDHNHNSGTVIESCCENTDMDYRYANEFPQSHEGIDYLFVCLGTTDSNHVLTEEEGEWIANYLVSGGNVYMEGGDTWFNDPQTQAHPYFYLEASENGSGDLDHISGLNGTFTKGMEFDFDGDNASIDHILPVEDAYLIMQNDDPFYGVAVANDRTYYRTIASSFEFGGLVDGEIPSTKDHYLSKIIEFFDGIYTSVDEQDQDNYILRLNQNYPNPFSNHTIISYSLAEDSYVLLEIFNIRGQRIKTLINKNISKGNHEVIWSGKNNNGNNVKPGIYFYNIKAGNTSVTKRLIIN